jgi:hypothetical protein
VYKRRRGLGLAAAVFAFFVALGIVLLEVFPPDGDPPADDQRPANSGQPENGNEPASSEHPKHPAE